MGEERKIQTCAQCKHQSPEVDGLELISSKYGWRLQRRLDSQGSVILEWRCPPCAERYKKLRALAGQSSGFHRFGLPATPENTPSGSKKPPK